MKPALDVVQTPPTALDFQAEHPPRIQTLDGLRAVAVLGVVWIHVWTYAGTPAWRLSFGGRGSIDVDRALAIVGNGVNLFFVLSGFCMYWTLRRKEPAGGSSDPLFARMLRNRWRRLAPGFYAAACICAAGQAIYWGRFPWYDLLAHLAFLHLLLPHTGGLCPPFWSLATEWQFYFFLPLFLTAARRLGFQAVLILTLLLSLLFRAGVYCSAGVNPESVGFYLPMHLCEFAWGMMIAHFYVRQWPVPSRLAGAGGFVFAAALAYIGRLMMVTEVVTRAGHFGPVLRILAEPVMTFGDALILWNVISSPSIFGAVLASRASQLIGRLSYGIYLLHWWLCIDVTHLVTARFGQTVRSQIFAFVAVLGLAVPAAWVFYHLFEAPYFRRRGWSRANAESSAATVSQSSCAAGS